MLTEITLKNFKCFKEKTHFPLSKINLLTGVNGGGKSSLLQVFLLFEQVNSSDALIKNRLALNGNSIELGTLNDIKNSETAIGTPIEIWIDYDKLVLTRGDQHEGCYYFQYATSDFVYSMNYSISVDIHDRYLYCSKEHFEVKHLFIEEHKPLPPHEYRLIVGNSIHYIAADRIGPQNFYLYTNTEFFPKIDKQGKYAPSILYDKRNDIVYTALCLGQDSQTVLQQTEEWLNEIFDGAKVELKAERDTISMSYNTKRTPNRYKPSNVGFGYSCILPIIISGLIARKESILIVENPEAHLHPKAQSKLTKFLAKVASCGVQVFIETHSEHILNALRVVSVSKDYEIKNTDISVLYFQNDDNQLVIPIPIQENGGIEVWPDGFFDQTDKDFKILFGF